MPVVIVPPPYQGPTRGQSRIEVQATSVGGAIADVEAKHPGFAAQVFAADGAMHDFTKVFLNGEAVESDELDRAVADGDEIEVVAAIAGG